MMFHKCHRTIRIDYISVRWLLGAIWLLEMFVVQSILTRYRYECSFREQSLHHWCGRRHSSTSLRKRSLTTGKACRCSTKLFFTWFIQVTQAFCGNLRSWVPIFGCLITAILKVLKVKKSHLQKCTCSLFRLQQD